MSKEDGGPAFPTGGAETHRDGSLMRVSFENGMTLRDYFAAKAIRECMRRHSVTRVTGDAITTHTDSVAAAREAYYIADAMLAARKAV